MKDAFFLDSRIEPRYTVICSVVIYDGFKEHFGVIKNLSRTGILIESADRLVTNGEYTLKFVLPNGNYFNLTGTHVWTLVSPLYRYGMKLNLGFFNNFKMKRYLKKFKAEKGK